MILLFFTVFSSGDNVNECCSSNQFGYTLFGDKLISALRAITGSVAARVFIDKLAQSLISSGYILSKNGVMDGGSSPEWVKKFTSLCHKPVEGMRVFDGSIDDSGRALRRRNGFSASKKSIARKMLIIKPCFLRTFTETYPNLLSVRATQKEEAAPEPHPALEPMDLLRLENSRLLIQTPLLGGKSVTDHHVLLPIFVDSGIEEGLDQFDWSTLYSQLPQRPAAGKKSTPKSYARLANGRARGNVQDNGNEKSIGYGVSFKFQIEPS